MKVSEICKYAPKSNIKARDACDGGKYVFFTSSADESKRYNAYQHEGEGIIMGTGGNATLHYYDGKYAVSTDCIVLLPNEQIRCKYLYYFFLGNMRVLERGFKGAGLKHTNKGYIGDIDIGDIPSFERQEKIIGIFDTLQSIIDLRKSEIERLDNLIKARFVELFGNPVLNEKGWESNLLAQLTLKIGSGATPKGGREAYQEEGIALIRSMNVYNGKFEYKDLAHISDEQAAKLDNVIIKESDVLLNITGASVARSCVVPNQILPARVNQHVCIIRCKECIEPIFLNRLLIDDNYQKLLWEIAGSGATREAITKQQVERLKIILPPIELQNQFADFVRQVDKSKVAVQKALDETQTLFDSLMQEYFG